MIKIKHAIILCSFLGVTLVSCAQLKILVQNIYATYQVHMPGNIPVDRNGNAILVIDTSIVIYVESTSAEIQWVKVWRNHKSYSILSSLLTNSYLDAGVKSSSDEKMIIRAAKGNKLWQLQLMPEEKSSKMPTQFKISADEMLLQGTYRGKMFFKKITYQTELQAIPSV